MSQHCIGGCMSDVHTADAGGTTGQLALLRDSILVSALPPSTGYFEEGAKNYSVLTHNHFIKQVSQTVGQRWLIAVAMEVQEPMLPPGDPHFLSHQALLGPDFLSYREGKIRELSLLLVSSCGTLCIFSTTATQWTYWGYFFSSSPPQVYYLSVLSPLFYFIQASS